MPAGLVVLSLAIGASTALDLSANRVEGVGELPSGLPSLTFEPIPLEAYLGMILPAIVVLLVAYSEAVAVVREFATRHGYVLVVVLGILAALLLFLTGGSRAAESSRDVLAEAPALQPGTAVGSWVVVLSLPCC